MSEGRRGSLRWRALPAIAYAAAVFYGGVIDLGPLPQLPEVPTDKLLHAGAFTGLEILVELAFPDVSARRRRALGLGVSVSVGALLELVQSALPYRSAELLDLVADALGAVLGALFMLLTSQWLNARRTRSSAQTTAPNKEQTEA